MRGKARVERPMPYVRDSFWRGREFTSLARMQAEAARWSVEVAGQRPCRPLDGAAPAAVFAAVETGALRPLPAEPFVLATWAKAKIGTDIHARVDKVLYSVPWRHIGKTADVRITATMVQFFIGGQLVKTHPRKEKGKQTDFADYPPEKIAFHMRTPTWCRRQAAAIGPACAQVIAGLLADNALYRLRSAQGVIGLADRNDPARLETACAKAIAAGDPSYRTVKGILAAGAEADALPAAAGDGGAAAFLRGPASFANIIPMPGTVTSDAVHPARAQQVTS
jgi:Mu transposase, C-terminal domain